MVDSAMEDRPHEIDGRELKPKRAVPKEEANDPQAHAEVSLTPSGGVKRRIDLIIASLPNHRE